MATMASKRDYYEVLGVAKEAAKKDIDNAYRKLAVKYHPDRNPGDKEATERFKEAAEAYEILSDPQRRQRYDQYGHAGVAGQGHEFNSAEDIFDVFGQMFGGGMFDDIFGGQRGRGGRRVRRGADLRCDVTLELEEAARGAKKTVEFDRHAICDPCQGSGAEPGSSREKCRRCGGHGQVVQSAGILRVQTTCPSCGGAGSIVTQPCRECSGQGVVIERRKLDVNIPAGVNDGMRVRLNGEGEPSPDGGPRGDLYCFVSVRKHKLFQRDGGNLVLQMPISYSQAALGCELEIPTLTGRTKITLQQGTQSGDVIRVRGQGMPDVHSGRTGDLLVQTHIEVPKKLSPKHEELLRELAEHDHVHVTPHRKSFLETVTSFFTGGGASDEATDATSEPSDHEIDQEASAKDEPTERRKRKKS